MKEGTKVFGRIYQTDTNGISLKTTDVGLISISWNGIEKISDGIYSQGQKTAIPSHYFDYSYMMGQPALLPLKNAFNISFAGFIVPTACNNFINANPFANLYIFNGSDLILPLSLHFQHTNGFGFEAGFSPYTLLSEKRSLDFYLQPKYIHELNENIHFGFDLTHFRYRQNLKLENSYYGYYYLNDTAKYFHNQTMLTAKITLGRNETNLTVSVGAVYENYKYLDELDSISSNGSYYYSYYDTLQRNEFLKKPMVTLSGIMRLSESMFLLTENKFLPQGKYHTLMISFGIKMLTRKVNIDLNLALYSFITVYKYNTGSALYYNEANQKALLPNFKITYKMK